MTRGLGPVRAGRGAAPAACGLLAALFLVAICVVVLLQVGANLIDALIKLAQGREQAYKAAMADAAKKGISIDPGDAQWRALWQDYRNTHGMAKPSAKRCSRCRERAGLHP